MRKKQKLHLMRKRRGLMICDVSFLLGHDSPTRVKRIEKGKAQMTLDEAIKIAHILDVDIEEIHLGNKKEAAKIIKQRAIVLARQFVKKAYLNRFKKCLLWLTQLIIRKK